MRRQNTLKKIFISALLVSGCQSVMEKSEVSNIKTDGSKVRKACQRDLSGCKDNGVPMVCTADRYNEEVLPDWHILKGWGGSICAAKNDLYERACIQGLEDKNIGQVSCAPDPSEGECGKLVDKCQPDEKPAYCFASLYDGTKLKPGQIIAGRGKGECKARFSLMLHACLQNLNPTLLDDVACLKDSAAKNCPVEAKSCAGDYFPFICEGRLAGGVLKKKFDARIFAENSCLAEVKLKQTACNLNISPENIKDSRCYADR